MDREKRKSGLSLAFAGLLGMLFFWLTDPVWGVAGLGRKAAAAPAKPAAGGEAQVNPIDARNEAWVGTAVGLGGSAAVLVFGLVIAVRRPT